MLSAKFRLRARHVGEVGPLLAPHTFPPVTTLFERFSSSTIATASQLPLPPVPYGVLTAQLKVSVYLIPVKKTGFLVLPAFFCSSE